MRAYRRPVCTVCSSDQHTKWECPDSVGNAIAHDAMMRGRRDFAPQLEDVVVSQVNGILADHWTEPELREAFGR